jgi:ubiquinone/menaquinone biosynthesis C-methylase UbiE
LRPGELTIDAVSYHSQLASGWERRYRRRSFRSRQVVLAECLAGIELQGAKWLDAGCGSGMLSRWLAERGCHVLGVDAASEMLAAATELTSGTGLGSLEFAHVGSIAQLPSDDSSQDGILCSSVLEYVADPAVCLEEFRRTLKPNGLLVVSVPNRESYFRRFQVWHHRVGRRLGRRWAEFLDHSRHEYSAVEFADLLTARGFSVESIFPFGSPLARKIQRSRRFGSLLMFVARKLAGDSVGTTVS